MSDIISENPKTTSTSSTRANAGVLGLDHQRLFYLHDLTDYKVHHDDPDVRGWTVKLGNGTSIGKIENLVVDKAAQKVRYVEVTADTSFFSSYDRDDYYLDRDSDRVYGADHDSHFLVPIGMVRLDRSDNECYVEGIAGESMGSVPRYRRGTQLRPSYEVSTLGHYQGQGVDVGRGYDEARYRDFEDGKYRSLDDQFYTSGYFNDDRYYDRHREAQTSASL